MPVTAAAPEAPAGRPLDAGAFGALMDGLLASPPARMAVAVSGGADSMALALLARDWARGRGVELTALTLDHRLRATSTDEAALVGRWLAARGIAHDVLAWTGGDTVRRLGRSAQDAARDARYALLTAWCRAHACVHLLLAHHADDQVETFLIRLTRGSGLQGLGGMDPLTVAQGVTLLRPLLEIGKEDLIATCRAAGQEWVDDPSNRDPKYTRTRFRQARALLEAEGLSRDRLLATIANLRRARAALGQVVDDLRVAACVLRHGQADVSWSRLTAAPEDVGLRLLSDLLCRVGGQVYGPRLERLQRLYARLAGPDFRAATLHGCVVSRRDDVVRIRREDKDRRG